MMCLGHGDTNIVLSIRIWPINRGNDRQLMLIDVIYVGVIMNMMTMMMMVMMMMMMVVMMMIRDVRLMMLMMMLMMVMMFVIDDV